MSNIQIRKAQADDLAKMQCIARQAIDMCYRSFLGDEGVDWYINSGESDRELEKHIGNCDVLLQDDTIIAFSIYFDDLIHLMMVDESRHHEGLGSHLLRYAEQQLFTDHDVLCLNTFDGNEQAISFYLRNGWSETHSEEDSEHDFVRRFFEKRLGAAGDAA